MINRQKWKLCKKQYDISTLHVITRLHIEGFWLGDLLSSHRGWPFPAVDWSHCTVFPASGFLPSVFPVRWTLTSECCTSLPAAPVNSTTTTCLYTGFIHWNVWMMMMKLPILPCAEKLVLSTARVNKVNILVSSLAPLCHEFNFPLKHIGRAKRKSIMKTGLCSSGVQGRAPNHRGYAAEPLKLKAFHPQTSKERSRYSVLSILIHHTLLLLNMQHIDV